MNAPYAIGVGHGRIVSLLVYEPNYQIVRNGVVTDMHIEAISVRTMPPLQDADVSCDQRVNLFIGPNACGKSTLLRAIKEFHIPGTMAVHEYGSYDPTYGSFGIWYVDFGSGDSSFGIGISTDWPTVPASLLPDLYRDIQARYSSGDWPEDPSVTVVPKWDAMPFVYVPATRIPLLGQHVFSHQVHKQEMVKEVVRLTGILGLELPDDIEAMSLEQILTYDPLKALFDTDPEVGFFHGPAVELTVQQIRNDEQFKSRRVQNQLTKALEIGYSCSQEICQEIIYDVRPHPYVHEILGPARIVRDAMGIGTSDDIDSDPLYVGVLSSGTQSTLLWVWALVLKMVTHYDWTKGWEDKPAILLIDEIENHLHPTWQRRVIPALLKHFPGLQIFATTHSPFVVAGLKAGQVHLLKRADEGTVIATTNTEDIVGWTADEILRTMMGVEDPTDDATAAAARELRQLRNEMPLTDDEAEPQRQERMQELRKKVDRDLLAGGPMAAQRERFEEDFRKALEEYRRSRELNQDNG